VKGDLVADSCSIVARWRNYFSQLLNVHGVIDVRHTELDTADTLVPGPSAFEFELAIEKLICHKSPGIDHIQAEMIKAGRGVRQFAVTFINLLFLFGIRGNCLRSGRNRSLYLSIRRTTKQTAVIIVAHHFCQLRTKFYPASCCLG